VVVPDVVEPVAAWRVWLLDEKTRPWRLDSVILTCRWPVRQELTARCLTSRGDLAGDHFAPLPGCKCGVYGAARIETLMSYIGFPYRQDTRPRVVGLVSLWGKVLEHEQGWRASHAYPLHLWLPILGPTGRPIPDWERIAVDLADYGVPVEIVEHTDAESVLETSAGAWQRRLDRRAA
jgi:hypothetical protein